VTWLRFLFAVVCALAALPGLFTFQSLLLWKVTLAVGEYGHRFALVPALLLLWGLFDRGPFARLSSFLCIAALTVFLLPTVLMLHQGRTLNKSLNGAFGLALPAWQADLPGFLFGSAPAAPIATPKGSKSPSRTV
jgi:hypothetical protein